MTRNVLTLFLAAGACMAFAAELPAGHKAELPAEALSGRLAARGVSGLVEITPDLSRERGTLEGLRGCTDGTEECDDSSRFRAARAFALPGESLSLFVEGTEKIDRIQVLRNGTPTLEFKDVAVPAELNLFPAADEDTVTAILHRGAESLELSVSALNAAKLAAKAAVSGAYMTNYVWISGGVCSPNWYEVIPGSGTGGRCRGNYTDRASRGEDIFALYDGRGTARVGWKYTVGRRSTYTYGPWGLPTYLQFTVSRDSLADELYTFMDGARDKEIPIGTRPAR